VFIKAIPILPVNDMLSAISFYESKLGFTAINMGNRGIVKRGEVELQLQLITGNQPLKPISCCIYIVNIEDHYAELSSKEMVTLAGRLQKNYAGIAEFFLLDNNGNTLYFRGIK
jgi:hypothetical protein